MDNEKCRLLIQLYGARELLWNSKTPHYHNKSLRQDAWNDISSIISDVPIAELKKKMTTLLASYRREKSRVAKSLITGSGTQEIYVSKWFAYDDFNFLRNKDTPNETADTMPDEEPQDISNTQNVTANNNEETLTSCAMDGGSKEEAKAVYKAPTDPKMRYKKRKPNTEEESPMLKKAFQILAETSATSADSYSSYGQHIANELRKYDQHTLVYVKQALNHVIFEADLGKYSHYGHNNYYQQPNYNTSQSETPSPLQSPHSSAHFDKSSVPSSSPSNPSPQLPTPSPGISIPLSSPQGSLSHSPQPTVYQLLLTQSITNQQSSAEDTIEELSQSEIDLLKVIHSFSN